MMTKLTRAVLITVLAAAVCMAAFFALSYLLRPEVYTSRTYTAEALGLPPDENWTARAGSIA